MLPLPFPIISSEIDARLEKSEGKVREAWALVDKLRALAANRGGEAELLQQKLVHM